MMHVNQKRQKTRTVLQMEAVECGAASLAMILAYHGKILPLEQLRYDCGVSRDGSKANNVLKAARMHGLEAKGAKIDIPGLEQVKFPCIIYWNFNHFLVLEGVKNGKAYLNDPASGHRVVDEEEFNGAFTGIVLEFEKGPNFKKGGERPSVLGAVKKRLEGYGQALILVTLIGLALVFPGLILPVFSKVFVDDILVAGHKNWFWPLVYGMLFTAAIRGFLEYLRLRYLLRIQTRMSLTTSGQFLWHVLRLPIDFFQQRYTGEIAERVQTNDRLSNLFFNQIARNFIDVFVIIFYLLIMLQYDVLLSMIGIVFVILNVYVLRQISKRRVDKYNAVLMEEGKMLGVAMSGLKMIESLKATGRENDFFKKWAGHFAKVINAKQSLANLSLGLGIIPGFLNTLTTIAILLVGSLRVMDGYMTMGMLIGFQSLMASFTGPVMSLMGLANQLQEAEADMNRLDDVLNNKVDPITETAIRIKEPESIPKFTKTLDGYIEFRNVTFGYSRLAPPLIENFNLTIKPGERVALVGGSGSGKSTVSKLLAGLYQPWSGEIFLDGVPRSQIPREVLNNSIAMVDQDIFMFEGTIKDIITLWDDTISDDMVIRACKDAVIHDVIGNREKGYQAILKEGGKNMSGGQRQRLEIARALVINPSILILDEATSALDPITEKLVYDNIKRRACSVVVVAHRLSTIRDSNEIIVMKYGKIVERGTHETLRDLGGEYAQLIKT